MKSMKIGARMAAVFMILGAMVLGISNPYESAMSSFIDGYGKTRLEAQGAAAAVSKGMMMTLGGLCAAFMLVVGFMAYA